MKHNTKVALRMCLGCNQMKEKGELIRLAKLKNINSNLGSNAVGPAQVLIDCTFKMGGRGAYICKNNAECLKKLKKSRRIERVLRCKLDESIYETLDQTVAKL